MNYLSVNLLSRGYRDKIKEILKDTKQIPYSVNPTKNEYLELLKNPLSSFDSTLCVRIGINKNKLYMFPGSIFHYHMELILGTEFDTTFRYEPTNKLEYLTDEPLEFEYLDDTEKEKLSILISSILYYIPATKIYSDISNSFLLDFSNYITPQKDKKVELVNNDPEPQYASTIRKYHTESSKRFSTHYIKEDLDMGQQPTIDLDKDLQLFKDMLLKLDWNYNFTDDFREFEINKKLYDQIIITLNELVQNGKLEQAKELWINIAPEEYTFPNIVKNKTSFEINTDNFLRKLMNISVAIKKKDNNQNLYLFLPRVVSCIISWKIFNFDVNDVYSRQFPAWSRCSLSRMLDYLELVDISFDDIEFINVDSVQELPREIVKKVLEYKESKNNG